MQQERDEGRNEMRRTGTKVKVCVCEDAHVPVC